MTLVQWLAQPQVRRGSPVGWNNSETGPRIVDCSGLSPDLNVHEEQESNPMAVVHWPVLSCCHGKHLRTVFWLCVSSTESSGEARVDGNAFSDRDRSLRGDAATGRRSPVVAGVLLWAIVALGPLLLIVPGWIRL